MQDMRLRIRRRPAAARLRMSYMQARRSRFRKAVKAFLNVMKTIIDKANAAGVYCSVCGEMASNPIEALALIGLGYRNLSSSGASFGKIKGMIRSVNTKEITDYMQLLLKSTRDSLRPQLIAYAYDHGIEIY